jgi:hypothetical protein
MPTINYVRQVAKELGVKTARMKKEEIIRKIQETEGNFPCFGTAEEYCDQFDCRWRDDCLNRNGR